jgi:hypothetical protein
MLNSEENPLQPSTEAVLLLPVLEVLEVPVEPVAGTLMPVEIPVPPVPVPTVVPGGNKSGNAVVPCWIVANKLLNELGVAITYCACRV